MADFYNTVKVIQIEHSSLCNAACPQCLREWWGGDHSRIKPTFIPTEFYENRIPDHVYANLEKIIFCGTVGDSCTAPNFIDVCRVVKQKNPNIEISVATNGGMRTPEWWAELGSVLTERDHVTFGIDGLEDTNYIYRVNVKWNKLMANVKAFIAAGGHAHWQFVSFEHNEHQIEECKLLSEQIGFKRFFTIYNNRFIFEELFKRTPSLGGNGLPLRPPKAEQEISIIVRKNKVPKTEEQWAMESEKGCIDCQAKRGSEAYIDAEGHLMPCCYIAGAKFTLEPTDPDGYYGLWTNYGADKINLNYHDWDSILAGEFYTKLTESWTKTYKEGRLLVCSATCNTREEAQVTEYKSSKYQDKS
jgi:MoaA/NifB/PqqE/SkfB family radical SAM enzyme